MSRPLDTEDDVYDYQFDYASGQATNPLATTQGLASNVDAMII